MFSAIVLSVALTFQANKHPPLATLPRPTGPSASSANSIGQKHLHCTIPAVCACPNNVINVGEIQFRPNLIAVLMDPLQGKAEFDRC